MEKDALTRHRRRQGLIVALLLLGPAPIALELFYLGDTPTTVGLILAEIAALIAAMLVLYGRQRKDARVAGLPVLPAGQVGGLLTMVFGIAGGTFMLPSERLAPYGLACITLSAVVIYTMGIQLRRSQEEPDERSAVLVLGLMAVLIAFGGAFV